MRDNDRWETWMIVKSLDMPWHRLEPLLARLGIHVHEDETCKWVSKRDFRDVLNRL